MYEIALDLADEAILQDLALASGSNVQQQLGKVLEEGFRSIRARGGSGINPMIPSPHNPAPTGPTLYLQESIFMAEEADPEDDEDSMEDRSGPECQRVRLIIRHDGTPPSDEEEWNTVLYFETPNAGDLATRLERHFNLHRREGRKTARVTRWIHAKRKEAMGPKEDRTNSDMLNI